MLDLIRADFDRDGWCASGLPLFEGADLAEIQQHFDAVVVGTYDLGTPPHGTDTFGRALTKVSCAWWADSVIRRVVLDPRLAIVAAILLDVDDVYLWADSLYWKAPLTHSEQAVVGWHQDKQYWDLSSTDKMITAIVHLYAADALSGGMRFAAGSHAWGLVGGSDALTGGDNTVPHGRPRVPPGQRWREQIPTLDPGQVTWHHCLTFHSSGPNLSEEPRRSITIHMVAGEGVLARATADPYFAGIQPGQPFRGPHFPRLHP